MDPPSCDFGRDQDHKAALQASIGTRAALRNRANLRGGARVLILAAATPLTLPAQPKPPTDHCDVSPDAPLALVIGPKHADLWNSSAPSMKFPVPAGNPVAIGKRDGDWTCVSHYGSGLGWMLTKRLQPLQPDLHPPAAAWTGT